MRSLRHNCLRFLRFATILFVSVILLSIPTIPSVASQTATTITSILTETGLLTSTSYSTGVVGTTTLTASMTSSIFSTTNSLKVYGGSWCSWNYWNFTVNPGTDQITGRIGASSATEMFYIVTPQQYSDFESYQYSSSCGTYEGGEIEVTSLTSAYSLNWMNPPPGTYYALFYKPVGASALPIQTPFTLVAISTEEMTSMIYAVATSQVTLPSTKTVTSLQVSELATGTNPLTGIPGFPLEAVLLGLIIGLAILLLRRSKVPWNRNR